MVAISQLGITYVASAIIILGAWATIMTMTAMTTTAAYAQQQEGLISDETISDLESADAEAEARIYARFNPTQQALAIITSVRNDCEANGFIGNTCVSLEYESGNTLVLTGDRLLLDFQTIGTAGGGGNWPNPYIWKAVDQFKAQGYTLLSTELGGQGSQGNPHDWLIVMQK
jgi:hypothetical protein